MTNLYKKEILKLAEGLLKRGVPFEFKHLHGGFQILTDTWDAICHECSYGSETGKLEVMGSIVDSSKFDESVEGYLDAEEVLRRVDLQLGIQN